MPRKFYRKKKTRKSAVISKKRILDIVHNDGMQSKIYKMTRWYQYPTYLYNNAVWPAEQGFAFEFKLNDVINYTEFTDLYDSYCISKVDLHFIPIGLTDLSTPTGDNSCVIGSVRDYDDSTVPGSMNLLCQYDNFRVQPATKPLKISVVPRVATEVFKTNITSGYGLGRERTWLDCANADIPHYGVKAVMTSCTAGAVCYYAVYIKYHFEFRNVR